jgi:hypothetical protein
LIGVIGQRTRVYEVMRRARPLSLNMIRRLHSKLEIPAEALIQPVCRGGACFALDSLAPIHTPVSLRASPEVLGALLRRPNFNSQ